MRKSYPSDISRAQFDAIRPLLESARKKTCPRRMDLHEVFRAALYLLAERLPVASLARRFSQVARGAFVLCHLERAAQRRQPAGAGVKKIRLARPASDRGATFAARS
jgi:hypothetical protein